MGTAQVAAASFLKLLKDVQDSAHQHAARTGILTYTMQPSWQQEAAQQPEQLYDPFEQHGGNPRLQTVSFDGFEPLRTGADSNEPPTLHRRWRSVSTSMRIQCTLCTSGQGTSHVQIESEVDLDDFDAVVLMITNRRPFGSKHQWQQLPQRLAVGKARIINATAGELMRLPEQLRQQRRALLAEDRSDRGSRPAFRPTNNLVLNPLANWVSGSYTA
jgi:hypothetical protein